MPTRDVLMFFTPLEVGHILTLMKVRFLEGLDKKGIVAGGDDLLVHNFLLAVLDHREGGG